MLPARTYSISINREWRALYELIWRPDYFSKWASGLADSDLREGEDGWTADGPDGSIRVRFTPHNDLGVMDHFVIPAGGDEVHVPLRVVQNGEGAEIMLTLFRQPNMSDEKFAADAKWIARDLRTLKQLVEGRQNASTR